MRDGRSLIAADVGDTLLQQRLGDGENAFAAEDLALAEPQILDFRAKDRLAMIASRRSAY